MKKIILLSAILIASFASAQVQVPNLQVALSVDDTDYCVINKQDSNITKITQFKTIKRYLNTQQIFIPFDSTGTISAAHLVFGYITSTSAAGTTMTTPTATQIATALGSVGQGYKFDFVVDNTAGSSTFTVSLGSGLAALSVITGGNTLTIASGSMGRFSVNFYSTVAAKVERVY